MEAIKTRRSNRKYQDKPIPQDVLLRMLEVMRLAPSGSNRQPWKFIVVQDEALKQLLVPACHNQQFIAEAPVIIVACALAGTSERGACVNVSIALDHLTLAAVEEGLGTCWIGAFGEDEVKQLLGVPEDVRVVMLMPLGYPADAPNARPRKLLEEVVSWNKWS